MNGKQRRVHIRVHGRVQGVGFRFFTHRAAQRVGLVGFVKNMPNGDVEAEAQGAEEDVDSFLQRVQKGPSGSRVIQMDIHERSPVLGEATFEIRYF